MNKKLLKSSTFIGASLLLGGTLHAQLYWDTNSATAGAGTDASGTWDAAASNWTTDSTGVSATTTYTPTSAVVFAAGSDLSTATVTLGATQTVSSLTFEEGSVIINKTVNEAISAAGIISVTVSDGASATMNATGGFSANFDIQGTGTFTADAVTGGNVMNKTGTGTATFNRLDAFLNVNGGTVIYTGTNAAKLKNTTVNDGGTLRLTGNAFDGTKRNLAVNTGGQFELAAGVTQTVSFFTGSGSVSGETGSALKVGGDNKTTSFGGSISGDMDLFSIGTGAFTLSDTSSMEFVIGEDGVSNSILGDGVNLTTTNLNGTFSFDLTDADLTEGNSWLIVDVANLNEVFGGTFNIADFTNDSGLWTYDFNSLLKFSQSTGYLSVTSAVPEPSTSALLLGLATFGLIVSRRRR